MDPKQIGVEFFIALTSMRCLIIPLSPAARVKPSAFQRIYLRIRKGLLPPSESALACRPELEARLSLSLQSARCALPAARFLAGELSDDDFRALRPQAGLYIQRHAPRLRVAIPYGMLSSRQLRTLAHIAREGARGYGHFGTRQNIKLAS